MTTTPATQADILRPIIGIENRSAQEVFDIMCDRFSHRQAHSLPGDVGMRKVIERAVADDLIVAIYKAEGWTPRDKAGFATRTARCNSLYAITADARRNRYIATPRAALTPSALCGGDYAEAFDILVDVQSALVLTADHSQGATVASFVSSSTQYERLNRFLHERQHADPRSASALSGDVGRLERALRDVNDRVAAYGSEALGRTINDIVNAALTPSALPGDVGEK